MAEHWKADDVLHEKSGELVIAGGDGDGPAESFRSTSSLMVEDDHDEAESSLVVSDPTTKSSSLAEPQVEDGLSPLLANLSVRTGLSKYYKEKSQSFTNLSLVRWEDIPKKSTTYNTRMKACRGQASAGPGASRSSFLLHLPGPCSKIIAKKAMPKGSSDRLLSRARNKKPPAYGGNKDYMS